MTLQELASLPAGTKVKLDLRPEPGFDYGVISRGGAIVYIKWLATAAFHACESIIHISNESWVDFVADLSIDND